MKKTILEKLGLEPVEKLNKTICLSRVRTLKQGIKNGTYPQNLLQHAKYYASWYTWMAKKGGTRAKGKFPQRRAA